MNNLRIKVLKEIMICLKIQSNNKYKMYDLLMFHYYYLIKEQKYKNNNIKNQTKHFKIYGLISL